MQWTGKLIGGALGAVLGPLGAAVGAFVGHQYDLQAERRNARPVEEQFFRSTFRVMGHVAKADGRVTEREIEAASELMQTLRLTAAQRQAAIGLFNSGKAADFALERELGEVNASCHGHPAILRIFIEIQLRFALRGNDLSGQARARVARVAAGLGMDARLFARIEAALRGEAAGPHAASQESRLSAAYHTLEIDASVTDAELTRAYRRLMSRHHPDKLKANGLPDSMLEHAKQRTQAIREAYELLQKQRGFG